MVSIKNHHLGALRRPCADYVGTEVKAVSSRGVIAFGGGVADARWAQLPEFSPRQVNQLRTAPPVMTIDGTSLSAPPERCP